MDTEFVPIYTITVLVILLVFLMGYSAYQDGKQWDAFTLQHRCVVIRVEASQTMTTILTNGKVGFTTVPERKTYRCDDGKEYTK